QIFLLVKLIDRRFERSVGFIFTIYHAQSTDLWAFDPLDKLIDLLSRVGSCSWDSDADDKFGIIEYPKILMLCNMIKFAKLHPKANVRFVISVSAHSLLICHAWKLVDLDTVDGL